MGGIGPSGRGQPSRKVLRMELREESTHGAVLGQQHQRRLTSHHNKPGLAPPRVAASSWSRRVLWVALASGLVVAALLAPAQREPAWSPPTVVPFWSDRSVQAGLVQTGETTRRAQASTVRPGCGVAREVERWHMGETSLPQRMLALSKGYFRVKGHGQVHLYPRSATRHPCAFLSLATVPSPGSEPNQTVTFTTHPDVASQ